MKDMTTKEKAILIADCFEILIELTLKVLGIIAAVKFIWWL